MAQQKKKPRVSFIGLGTMGAPMARRTVRAAQLMKVFDARDIARRAFEGEDGFQVCASVADVAEQVDVLITMLPTTKDVYDVLVGQGVAERLPTNTLVIDMSTGDPEDTAALAASLRQSGKRFMDAPVCRGRREAETGQLLVLAGGEVEDLAQARPLLETMGEAIFHVGPVGSGIKLKLVNNYLSMVHMVLAAEGLVFAEKLGIERQSAIEVFSRTPAGRGQLLTNFPRKVLAGDITPDFPLSMGLKDLSLALKLGADCGMPLGLGAAARELYGLAKSWSRADEDCTAMLLLLEDISRAHIKTQPDSVILPSNLASPQQ